MIELRENVNDNDLITTYETFTPKILDNRRFKVKVVGTFSPSSIKVKLCDFQKEYVEMKNQIKQLYDENENHYKFHFNQEFLQYVGYPVIFKMSDQKYGRGNLISVNTENPDIIMIYDVDEYTHQNINKNNIFYITRKFLKTEKNIVNLAQCDILPKINNIWDKETVEMFSNFRRNTVLNFYVKKTINDHHSGWEKLNRNWSLYDWMIERNLAKLSPNNFDYLFKLQ